MTDRTRDLDTLADGPAAVAGELLADRYRLGDPLGEGGMGSVYRAEQLDPVRRAVAVKLIRAGRESAGLLRRFEAERQALARMTHPHIAKVYDAGTAADGRPFVVMELVDGPPLTDFCEREKLDRRARLELFRKVCDAVMHAHQKGVIHRDLKPSNILVGADGPKVIDFGLAKATAGKLTADTFETAAGSVLGTPAYMAPEQAWADPDDVDTRADVFALGAVLYELLTGTPPHRREDLKSLPLDELVAKVRAADIPPPGKRAKGLPRDLDWIALKALAKDRERRYASPADLAEDVRRHLADEPVSARRPSRGYRLRKFARRNRAGMAVAGLVVVVLTAIGWGVIERRRRAVGEVFQAELQRDAETLRQTAGARSRLELVADWLDGGVSDERMPAPTDDRPPAEQVIPASVIADETGQTARALADRPPAELGSIGLIYEKGLQQAAADVANRFGRHGDAVFHARRVLQLDAWEAEHYGARQAAGETEYVTMPPNAILGTDGYEFEHISHSARGAARSRYQSLVRLAMYQGQAGQMSDARGTLAAAADARPDPPKKMRTQFDEEHWQLGLARAGVGDWERADDHFRMAVDDLTGELTAGRSGPDPYTKRLYLRYGRWALWAVNQFAAGGRPDLAVKWLAEFQKKGWLPADARSPRP